ncbi:MAG: hypothetical protein OEW98_00120 [Betaproteobacteria bacterium]|nr:hypothetical protein [Betaproteobacteria bacterium]
MTWGGKRVGAGRKPKTQKARWLGGNAGKRPLTLVTPERVPAEVPAEALDPPSILTPAELEYWHAWAGLAMGRGLLHAGTLPGFVLLCQQAAFAASLRACIEARGYEQARVTIDGSGQEHTEYKANSLITQWRSLMARIETLQARYGLAADGKLPAGSTVADTDEQTLAQLLAVR